MAPWANKWLCGGVALPVALHLGLLYTPGLRNLFGLAAITAQEWRSVLAYAFPILIVEELLKAVGRYLDHKQYEQRRTQDAARAASAV